MARVKVVKEKRNKQKRERKPFPRFALKAAITAVISVAALIWALPKLPQKPQSLPQANYKGIIELWNVESFEGGSNSRASWLTSRSAKFELKYKGLFVHVATLTADEMKQKLCDGQNFDIICFSRGAGNAVLDKLAPLSSNFADVRENMLLSAQLDGKQYAVPLYAGAYCLFARVSQLAQEKLLQNALTATYARKIGKNTVELSPLVCGFTDYNSPLTALAMSGCKGSASFVNQDVTQYSAYEKFVANNCAVTLLGTQRDLYRLTQREQNGRIEKLGFCALGGYTDLVQYVGISNTCADKEPYCREYVDFLLSKDTQSAIVNLSMFSVLNESIYSSEEKYTACEKELDAAFVPNVFADDDVIANQRRTAIATLSI